ncbi:hypothetical protein AbraIFM66950_010442 [Aspergillus brasiliensis]|nr:hypothetical protein AbraIFM66950_010442 [Aspergillus brasiliensis]
MLLALTQAADSDPKDYGKQHLFGARALINSMLQDTSISTTDGPVVRVCLGIYLYWDMSTSYLIDPVEESQGLNLFELSLAVHKMGDWYHPMYGTCSQLLFIIANVGRYCRQIHDMPQDRNLVYEAALETQLSTWTTSPPNPDLGHLYEGFRNHGLAFLHRSRAYAEGGFPDPGVTRAQESLIQRYAEETIRHLMLIPSSSYYLNFQSLPLLAAGSELTESHHLLRDKVRGRLRAIYSLNRLPANLLALQLIEELWDARDSGQPTFWLSHVLQKDWRLLLA